MRVLVAYGSKRGGTADIAEMLALALQGYGYEVGVRPAAKAGRAEGYDAVIIGGALYANRWHPDARRFVERAQSDLRKVSVWFFSSGPLDDSAGRGFIGPVARVQALMERVGAQGHVTFGGRLEPDARGFPASAMAREHSGDWRSPELIRAWAAEIAAELPTAHPNAPVEPPGGTVGWLALHAVVGWAICGAIMGTMMATTSITTALLVHAIAAPIVFAALAWDYFRPRGSREPLPAALGVTGIVILLDAVLVAGLAMRSPAMFTSIAGTWLPFVLIFLATWATGALHSTLPWKTDGGAGHGPVMRPVPEPLHRQEPPHIARLA